MQEDVAGIFKCIGIQFLIFIISEFVLSVHITGIDFAFRDIVMVLDQIEVDVPYSIKIQISHPIFHTGGQGILGFICFCLNEEILGTNIEFLSFIIVAIRVCMPGIDGIAGVIKEQFRNGNHSTDFDIKCLHRTFGNTVGILKVFVVGQLENSIGGSMIFISIGWISIVHGKGIGKGRILHAAVEV